jgi:hypothetical protein
MNYSNKRFIAWIKDGNVVQRPDGSYSTQDALWCNRIETWEDLIKYFINNFNN